MSCSNYDTSAFAANNPTSPLIPPKERSEPTVASSSSAGAGQCGGFQSFRFEQLPGDFTACLFPPGSALPDWVGGAFFIFCHGAAETSILCATELVPSHVTGDRDWQLFHVTSPPGLTPANPLAAVILPLKSRQIDVITAAGSHGVCFLVRRHALTTALMALQEAGHHLEARAGIESIPVTFLAT